jgi:hypothetical protein
MAKEVGSLVLLVFTTELKKSEKIPPKVPEKYQKSEGFSLF